MCGVWLVGALMLAAAGVNQTVAPPGPLGLIDANEDDVELMLGQPDARARFWPGLHMTKNEIAWVWLRPDWLGGAYWRYVIFSDGIVVREEREYDPFWQTPPWFDALCAALNPRPAP